MHNTAKNILRIGMAQIDCALGDLEYNIKKATEIINRSRGKVDFLIFPELSLTGYGVGKDFHKYAMRLNDARIKKLAEEAGDMLVAVGMIEETESFNFFNSQLFLKNGKIRHVHRKIYLPNYDIFEEKKYFSSGSQYESFRHSDFRVAPFVCGDAWNPALMHIAAYDEANLFVFSACSPDYALGGKLDNKRTWKRISQFYAMIYGSYVVFVNRIGTERDMAFHGNSTLIDPFGDVQVSAMGNEEKVLVGEVDIKKVREARIALNTMRDEDLRFIQRQLKQITENKNYL